MKSIGRDHFESAIYPQLFKYNKDYIVKLSFETGKDIPEKKIKLMANLQTFSLISFLINWLNGNKKQDLRELTELIKMLDLALDTWILNIITKDEPGVATS